MNILRSILSVIGITIWIVAESLYLGFMWLFNRKEYYDRKDDSSEFFEELF